MGVSSCKTPASGIRKAINTMNCFLTDVWAQDGHSDPKSKFASGMKFCLLKWRGKKTVRVAKKVTPTRIQVCLVEVI